MFSIEEGFIMFIFAFTNLATLGRLFALLSLGGFLCYGKTQAFYDLFALFVCGSLNLFFVSRFGRSSGFILFIFISFDWRIFLGFRVFLLIHSSVDVCKYVLEMSFQYIVFFKSAW